MAARQRLESEVSWMRVFESEAVKSMAGQRLYSPEIY
jgi:hypothetical protein